MENSMNSISRASYCNDKATYSHEESSWAMYFEDFLDDTDQEYSSISSGYERPSLISDAASSAVKKLGSSKNIRPHADKICEKSSCKRRKIVDDSLEDTASSPVSSLKDITVEQLDSDSKNMHPKDTSMEIETSFGHANKRNGFVFLNSGYYTELKRKGLCLVPLSILASYLG